MRRSLRLRKNTKADVVSLDLQIEILNRLPLKSVGRFLLVSKSWAKIIRSKCFIRSFPHRSLNQPGRFLIAFNSRDSQTGNLNWYFFSTTSSSSTSASTSTSFLSRIKCPVSKPRSKYFTLSYVNGLMSIGYGLRQIICNPCTGKSITLPKTKTTRPSLVRHFLGYDPVYNQYKVLCMKTAASLADAWSCFQVFTLGEEPKSWRLIDCSIPHRLWSNNGVCIDGVVYYIAGKGEKELSVVRFNVKSEKFEIFVTISEGLDFFDSIGPLILINYHGKVAVHTIPREKAIDLWVFEAGKQAFLELSFDEHPYPLKMKGVNHTGEIILPPSYSSEASVTRYDRKGASFKKMKIEVDSNQRDFTQDNYFLDYVESLMLL